MEAAPGGRVLIVEDNEELRENVAEFLEAKGFATEQAGTGPAGCEKAKDARVKLVLLDLGLPGMDGIEVCRRLRADGIRTPVLMLTARDELEEKETGLASGADGYIVKPFGLRELAERVRACLEDG